ncbi:hypothetical protein [Flavobacterium gyeonganense]|uniref:Uncharacterized protein n=1 Tax=Flavobacterium gyeonganense TaxID=1310418 RepID=A0ABV5H793_9FLAO|nr:hypothetical protein [Flavobacterium gyeonganense]
MQLINFFMQENNLFSEKGIDFDEYNSQLTIEAKELANKLYEKKIRPNYFHLIIIPFGNFILNYFLKLKILKGKKGFILSYIHAFATFKKYLFLWLKYRKME